ncbi:putative bifunctional diguanylate cyclase/phosphodiesterase [Aureimonas leprariae]|uniref:EAL domain-containing protein n=1 Tax=Plantimonas leprariae TaxID=2615207 RepID=A0A7V7PLP9_9HYPH|nr:EAL domain-containing protein [Aureimonas leprariae]KAB0677238.1 EAL domain-containing protein [Aureimonas leprariae]
MLARFRHVSLLYGILAAVTVVLLAVQVPSVWTDVVEERHAVEAAAKRQATAAIDMLEAVHIQAMLHRNRIEDGDPAIDTLNGSMEQFSSASQGTKLWVFMGPKVLDFQRAAGETEIEGPRDAVDEAVVASRQPRQSFEGNQFRLSRPVVLGEGHAASPRCAECHTAMMDITKGEVIGGYGAAVDLTAPLQNWRSGLFRQIGEAIAILIGTLAAIYILLRVAALRPLTRLSQATKRLAAGDTDVAIDLDNRRDAIGAMAGALRIFRDGLVAKRKLEAENEQAQSELRYLASHDTLTGLPNRALFRQRLAEALAANDSSLAVFCLDIDHFKTINDTLGHAAGDKFLQIVAERLRAAVGLNGFAARLGGDEFALVHTTQSGVSAVDDLCQALLAAFKDRVEIEGRKFPLTLSVGIALAPADGRTAEELLQHADVALYRAKGEGRNTYRFFDAQMNEAIAERRELEGDLREAFERGDLELHYQPLVDVGSGTIVAVEALMRWQHPERGWISPAVFIPIAETCGLIVPMGRWLLQTACAQAAMWPGISLSVNLSPAQFRDRDLVPFVAATLAEAKFPAERLEIEITEGLLLDASLKPLETLLALKALGVKIAMDDFGTGYSSLGYLQSFPFDKIKIDRSFVSAIETNPSAAAIVRSVVGLGQSLGMTTTAEGVETAGQMAFLQGERCDQVQGYLLAKPQDPLRLTALLGTWRDGAFTTADKDMSLQATG